MDKNLEIFIVIAFVVIIIGLIVSAIFSSPQSDMIKLESNTWYYKYEIGKDLYISKIAPIRDGPILEKDHSTYKGWYHPENKSKCVGAFYIPDPESSSNIIQNFTTMTPE